MTPEFASSDGKNAPGIYGPVSVDTFDGQQLPYADSLVNVIVASDPKYQVTRRSGFPCRAAGQ
jgi:hypothetical protein